MTDKKSVKKKSGERKTLKSTTNKKTIKKAVKKVKPDLQGCIIEGIRERKGEEIVVINFSKIQNTICDYFIICQGNSSRQVETIADSIQEVVRKKLGIKPYHTEGYENAQWILIDYLDIVVHILQPETRQFYRIEELWGDADTVYLN